MPMLLSVMMFLSAVFYPISSLPAHVQPLMHFNPLALVIEQTRQVAIEGMPPSLHYLTMGTIVGVAACEMAYRGFQRARRGFADVL